MYELSDTLTALKDSVALNTSLLHQINQNTLDTVTNTAHTWYDEQWCLYGVFALVISLLTLIPLWTEFKKDRIAKSCQEALFVDILRHLYRNKVCVIAMKVKYDQLSSQSQTLLYPSDEHFLKLQLLPDDIHVEQFYRDHTKFSKMHEIALLLRNYNTEIDVALKHITDPHIHKTVIERDFSTLNLKPGYISLRICQELGNLEFIQNANELIWKIIIDAQKENLSRNDDERFWGKEYEEAVRTIILKDKDSKGGYNKLLSPECLETFYQDLYRDVIIECGKNAKGSPKIGMVTTDIEISSW